MHWWARPSQCDVKWRRNKLKSFILKGEWGVGSAPPSQRNHFLFSIHSIGLHHIQQACDTQYRCAILWWPYCSVSQSSKWHYTEFSRKLVIIFKICSFLWLDIFAFPLPDWTWTDSEIHTGKQFITFSLPSIILIAAVMNWLPLHMSLPAHVQNVKIDNNFAIS